MASYFAFLALAAVPAFAAPISTNSSTGGISWGNCEDKPFLSGVQCGNLTVPVDWDAPNGETFTLSMVRLLRPANSTSKRIGSLFINPGGPGAGAVQFVTGIAGGLQPVAPEILNSFDLIGVDPRGVQTSVESVCDSDIWKERVSLFPKTQEEYDKLVDKNRRLGESCIEMTGDIIKHLDTISTVKDHEAVRAALGEKMNWLGLSYGTQIGSQYAQLYPDNIRAIVLDGMLQHSQSEATNILIESTAYAAALTEFFEWAGTDDESPLKGQDVEQFWYSILNNATETPIPAVDCGDNCHQDVTADEFRTNAQGFLITSSPEAKKYFAEALIQASEGDATPFSTQLPWRFDPGAFAGVTIGCQDWKPSISTSSFEDFQAKMRMAEELSPLNHGASQSWTLQASCVGWPATAKNPPVKLHVKTEEPILIVNALRDPSTGYAWAVGALEEIENHVLLTRNGSGHTSWGFGGKTEEAINHFLLTKETPVPGTVLES